MYLRDGNHTCPSLIRIRKGQGSARDMGEYEYICWFGKMERYNGRPHRASRPALSGQPLLLLVEEPHAVTDTQLEPRH